MLVAVVAVTPPLPLLLEDDDDPVNDSSASSHVGTGPLDGIASAASLEDAGADEASATSVATNDGTGTLAGAGELAITVATCCCVSTPGATGFGLLAVGHAIPMLLA